MRPPTPADEPADLVDAWLAAVDSDSTDAAHGPYPRVIFDAVRADRQGPVATRLLGRADDPRAWVRRAVLGLLTDLSGLAGGTGEGLPWDAAARVAMRALDDAEVEVRRCAAWLLVECDVDRGMTLLDARSGIDDPVVRLSLVEAILARPVQGRDDGRLALVARLCDDADPAVRLRACLEGLRLSGADRIPVWEAQIAAELPQAGSRLNGPGGQIRWSAGSLWGTALVRQSRVGDNARVEAACYARIAAMTSGVSAVVRRTAVDMAGEAFNHWRSAPAVLTPALTPLVTADDPDLKSAALEVIGGSLQSSRIGVEALAAQLNESNESFESDAGQVAVLALGRIGDPRAVPGLCAMLRARPEGDDRHIREADMHEALAAVVEAGVNIAPVVTAIRELLAEHRERCVRVDDPGACDLSSAVIDLGLFGPAAVDSAPELTEFLSDLLRAGAAHSWLASRIAYTLGMIGPTAAVAIPILERLTGEHGWTGDEARTALVRMTGDRHRAEAYLDAVGNTRRGMCHATHLLAWLADHGGLADRHAALLWQWVARPQSMYPPAAAVLWKHSGAAAATVLLEIVPHYIDYGLYGADALATLTDMGALARPALPALDRLINRPTRLTMYLGDPAAETRRDERLVDAAITTRNHIERSVQA